MLLLIVEKTLRVQQDRIRFHAALLPDIGDEAIFNLCHIGSIAWQFLTQHTVLQDCSHRSCGKKEQGKHQAIPGSQQQGRAEKEEETTGTRSSASTIAVDDPLVVKKIFRRWRSLQPDSICSLVHAQGKAASIMRIPICKAIRTLASAVPRVS
jgi:hypothetical protein